MNEKIFLPGGREELNQLLKFTEREFSSILVIGSGSEKISKILSEKFSLNVNIIVEDSESLSASRFILSDEKNIKVKMMDFSNTDFPDNSFELIFSQASLSDSKRNKTIKEIKRILNPAGVFCVGEIISKEINYPPFIKNVFDTSGIVPLHINQLKNFYEQKGFRVLFEKDLSYTLKDFYKESRKLLNTSEKKFSEKEINYYKKFLKKVSHESNVYLNLGGEKYIGFYMLILEKLFK